MSHGNQTNQHQDWTEVVFRKKKPQKPTQRLETTEKRVNYARSQGQEVEVVRKDQGGKNKQRPNPVPAWKLDKESQEGDDESPVVRFSSVSREEAQAIQKARMAKGWTQEQLAKQVNETTRTIQQYENGRVAVKDQRIMGKLRVALELKR